MKKKKEFFGSPRGKKNKENKERMIYRCFCFVVFSKRSVFFFV